MIMEFDILLLYRQMLRSRRFEDSIKGLWIDGKISREMHLVLEKKQSWEVAQHILQL